jgi:acyl-CoA reductase-like NAD-dependent aldehyde dehydrogenase
MSKEYRHYINGEWAAAANGATFETVDPATEEVIGMGGAGNGRRHRAGSDGGPRCL